MSDEEALLSAIIANPDEDTPRLVYADWLDENGQPDWAEFIRLQCDAKSETSRRRATELEARNRGEWLQLFPRAPGVEWEFRRGFPEVIRLSGASFLAHSGTLSSVRWVRSVCLWDMWNQTVVDFAKTSWNRHWTELELQEHPEAPALTNTYDTTPAMQALAACPSMKHIRRLRLAHFELVQNGISALATSLHLDALEYLSLDGDPDSPLFVPLRERFGERLVVT